MFRSKRRTAMLVIPTILLFTGLSDAQTTSVLDHRVGIVECREMTAESSIQAVARDSAIPILVNWKSIGGEEARSSCVNVSISGCTVRDAIAAILPGAQVYLDGSAIRIAEPADMPVTTRSYPVPDLALIAGLGGSEQVLQILEDCVAPDGWQDRGGPFGIAIYGSTIVATQTPEGHQAIAALIQTIRAQIPPRAGFGSLVNPKGDRFAPFSEFAVLHCPIARLQLRQTPLEAALAGLQAAAHCGAIVRWRELEGAGIVAGTPVTLDLSGRTLEQALGLLCELCQIDYCFHDGIIELIPRGLSAARVQSRVYDLHPLIDIAAARAATASEVRAPFDRRAPAREVPAMIQSLVETDSWKENGGAAGTIGALGDYLIVTNTPRAHSQIAALISDLQAASQPASPAAPKQPPRPDPLAAAVPELRLESIPLDRAIEMISERTHVQIVVDWTALESAGVDRSTPLSVRLFDASLGKSLTVILDLASTPQLPLAFRADDLGIVHVSTAENLGRIGVTRIYNIRDLVDRYTAYTRSARQSGPYQLQTSRTDAVDSLTKMIEDTIDTDSWKDNGGATGSLREFAGLLIVTNTPQNHQKITLFLDSLRVQAAIGAPAKP